MQGIMWHRVSNGLEYGRIKGRGWDSRVEWSGVGRERGDEMVGTG